MVVSQNQALVTCVPFPFSPSATNGQVPLGYKFSWSPKAVLTAALNPAQYKLDNTIHSIPGDDLLKSHFPSVPLWKGLALEGLANRDSLPYADKYGMGQVGDLKNLFRGTLRYVTEKSGADERYRGFSTLLDSFRKLGLLSSEPINREIGSWEEFLAVSAQGIVGGKALKGGGDMGSVMRDVLGPAQAETEEALQWSVSPIAFGLG